VGILAAVQRNARDAAAEPSVNGAQRWPIGS